MRESWFEISTAKDCANFEMRGVWRKMQRAGTNLFDDFEAKFLDYRVG